MSTAVVTPAGVAPSTPRRSRLERAPRGARVLVVDDEPAVLALYGIQLRSAGYDVVLAASAAEALALLQREAIDVVLSDISMPEMDGMVLLEDLHRNHPDLPVILATGLPSMETAIRAVELQAIRYLTKPVQAADLVEAVDACATLRRLALVERMAAGLHSGRGPWTESPALLERSFDGALATVRLAFQPIVDWPERRTLGWEVLLRHEVEALMPPPKTIDAAERLGRLPDLGRRLRELAALGVPWLPADTSMFVNLHPADLEDEQLYARQAPLSEVAPRVVLEITERQHLEGIADLDARIRRLRDLGFRIAVDDLGAGYSSLSSFAELAPDVVKLDMSLVHEIHASPTKRRLATSLVEICGELDVRLIAEGVETVEERDDLIAMGCGLFQGFLFGRPAFEVRPATLP